MELDDVVESGSSSAAGWAERGSQLQTQLYVNRRPDELTTGVLQQLPELETSGLVWRAPLEEDGFDEPQDRRFLRAIDNEGLGDRLAEFWPTGGPVWDALAVGDKGQVVLVEAKSHPAEIYGGGTKASPSSRRRIEAAIRETQRWLGIPEHPDRWLDPIRPGEAGHSSVYQSANRYAHLCWLRREGVDAWLVHVLFTDDPTYRGTGRSEWEAALPLIEDDLGLRGVKVPFADHVFLPGLDPDDVLSPGTLSV